jgi:hypothetical protein
VSRCMLGRVGPHQHSRLSETGTRCALTRHPSLRHAASSQPRSLLELSVVITFFLCHEASATTPYFLECEREHSLAQHSSAHAHAARGSQSHQPSQQLTLADRVHHCQTSLQDCARRCSSASLLESELVRGEVQASCIATLQLAMPRRRHDAGHRALLREHGINDSDLDRYAEYINSGEMEQDEW